MMKRISHRLCSPSCGLFLVRLALAAVFLSHGIGKLSAMDQTIGFFASIGFGAFWAWTVSIIEVLVGVAMLLGIFTKIAGILISAIMLVAIFHVKWTMGYFGFELDLVVLLSALAVVFAGSGPWSLARMFHGCHCDDCGHGCACDGKKKGACGCGCKSCDTPADKA